MLTKRTRESSCSSARFHTREVLTSTPITPLSTRATPSTTRSAAYVSAWKPASPGVSTRLILRSFHSRWQSDPDRDMLRRCSCSSQSETVVPCSMLPSRFVCSASKSRASTRDVFPTPRCPATAMLRIFVGSVAGMRDATRAGDRPQLVERGDRGAGDLAEALLELLLRDAELLRDLLVGRRPAQPRLELADGPFDVAGAGPDGARHPVHRAELVDDLALDPRHRVRLELHVAGRVVALDRANQSQQAVRDEVALVHVGR